MKHLYRIRIFAIALILAFPLLAFSQVFDMSPSYMGEIHAGYKTTTKVSGFDTYSGTVELGTLQGVSFNQYFDVGIGVDAFMLTHYYPDCDLRFGMNVYCDMRPAYPVNDKFKVFLDLGLGGFFGIHSEPEMGNGFFGQFGPGFRYRKLNLSLGMQNYGTGKGSIAFYAKIGLYF